MQDNIKDNEINIRNHAKNALQKGICEDDIEQANSRLNCEKQDTQQIVNTVR